MNWKSLFLLILTAIGIIVAYRVWGSDFDWSLFYSSLWNIQIGWLVISIVATYLSYVFRAIRWQILLDPVKSIRIRPLISANLVGFSAIFVLGRAGEVVRPLWVARRERAPLTAAVATIVVERFLDTFLIMVFFGWSLLLVKLPAAAGGTVKIMKDTAWVSLIGSIGALIFLFFFRSNSDRIVRYVPLARIASLLKSFSAGLSFLDRGTSLALVMAHSVLVWLAISLSFWFMMLGMNFQFSIPAATLVMVGSAIGSIAQIPGIGGGFQAGYVFCMSTFFSIPAEQAIATSLVAWVASYGPTVVAGSVYMISQGLSLKDLRTAPVAE